MNKASILAEIQADREARAKESEIQPNDITYEDLEALGMKRTAANNAMEPLIKAGTFRKLLVKGPGGNFRVIVFRRVEE